MLQQHARLVDRVGMPPGTGWSAGAVTSSYLTLLASQRTLLAWASIRPAVSA